MREAVICHPLLCCTVIQCFFGEGCGLLQSIIKVRFTLTKWISHTHTLVLSLIVKKIYEEGNKRLRLQYFYIFDHKPVEERDLSTSPLTTTLLSVVFLHWGKSQRRRIILLVVLITQPLTSRGSRDTFRRVFAFRSASSAAWPLAAPRPLTSAQRPCRKISSPAAKNYESQKFRNCYIRL